MICGRPRWIGGWWVTNTGWSFPAVFNRYTKGSRSFVYKRAHLNDQSMCRPAERSGERV